MLRTTILLLGLLAVAGHGAATTYVCENPATRLGISYICSPPVPELQPNESVIFALASEATHFMVQIHITFTGSALQTGELTITQSGLLPQTFTIWGNGDAWLSINGQDGLASATVTLTGDSSVQVADYQIVQVK